MFFFFFKQKTAYEVRISDWSSDVCSSDLFDRLDRLAGVMHVDLVQAPPDRQNLPGMNLDIARLALKSTRRLVDHDAGVGQGEALALLAGREQQRAHRCGLADAHGRNRTADVDRKSTRLNSSH